ncbi:DUF1214 domain-containing protein [Vibrio mexicanus]|uniref:DUF1214 domain-containing protein n=1 Tax=Vibrio mexicanus TaxID=1004326 RepID=UPI00063C6145|nr:DUF1214 domain-containing protein [Vibrio mexicanus]
MNDDLIFLFLRTQTFDYRDDGVANDIRQQYTIKAHGEPRDISLPERTDAQSVIALATEWSDGWERTNPGLEYMIDNGYTLDQYKQTANYVYELGMSGIYTNNRVGFTNPEHPTYDEDMLAESFVTHMGHLGFPAYHAYYEMIPMTPEGELLNGSEAFTLTFPHEQAVGEFWSLTRYASDTRLPLNPEDIHGSNRQVFAGGNTSPDADGNVTITFSSEDPQDGTYWMPVIDGENYYLVMRYYAPQPELEGKTMQSNLYGGTPLENIIVPSSRFSKERR